jgi:hypothetical protein
MGASPGLRSFTRGGSSLGPLALVCAGRSHHGCRRGRCLPVGRAGYDGAMIKKLVILALLVALGVIAAKRLRGD